MTVFSSKNWSWHRWYKSSHATQRLKMRRETNVILGCSLYRDPLIFRVPTVHHSLQTQTFWTGQVILAFTAFDLKRQYTAKARYTSGPQFSRSIERQLGRTSTIHGVPRSQWRRLCASSFLHRCSLKEEISSAKRITGLPVRCEFFNFPSPLSVAIFSFH